MLIAYRQAAERLGAVIVGHTPVTGIRVAGGSVQAVVTARGEIRTPVVVDAAGVWARRLASLAGADVPIQPMRHQLRITSPRSDIAPDQPIVRMTDASAYVRPARGGLMVGGFEADPMPMDPDKPAEDKNGGGSSKPSTQQKPDPGMEQPNPADGSARATQAVLLQIIKRPNTGAL